MTPEEFDAAKKEAKGHLDFVSNLLDQAKQAASIFPYLQQAYEMTYYYYNVISTMPESTPEGPKIIIFDSLSSGQQFCNANREQIQRFDQDVITSYLAFNASGSIPVYQSLSDLSTASNTEVSEWASPFITQYRDLQQKQKKTTLISSILQRISKPLDSEFQSALQTYKKAFSNLVGKEAAGIALRNVLEHFKGEIHSIALKIAKRTKPAVQKLKWIEMSSFLAKGGSTSFECNQLISEEGTHRSLHDRLTMVAKNRSTISDDDLEDIFVELIEHIYAVLNLIDLTHF